MIMFNCDYVEGAHPEIIRRISECNLEQNPGYSEDKHCAHAAEMIKELCGREDIDIHFLVGGTQANLTVLSAILKPYQGAICADGGHINCHETGAIEATGHKVLPIPTNDCKLTGDMVRRVCEEHFTDETHEHMVMPGAVYISDSTEIGTVYTRNDLLGLRKVCDEYGMKLFLDGARLGYAMASEINDMSLKDLAELCDAFYIGGTKQGALFGEAVVLVNNEIKKNFRYLMKQKGAMLAKGWLTGIQYEVLFENNLYFDMSKNAVRLAMMIRKAAEEKGLTICADSPTNQQFIGMPDDMLDALEKKYVFANMTRIDDNHRAVRVCTSWATKEENVDKLIADIMAF